MRYLMSSNVATLGESLVADVAGIRLLAGMTTFMGLMFHEGDVSYCMYLMN